MNPAASPCWIPERIVTDGNGEGRCRWVDIAGVPYADPFFESTLMRRRQGADAERWSTTAELCDEAARVAAPVDVIFILHVSRCGSTLVSQLFGLDERTIVLSEVPLLDAILRTAGDHRDVLFPAALRLLASKRAGSEERVVVKTDCWHLFHAATLRRLYPQAKFLLLYRRPAAVLRSHHRMRGVQMVPGVLTGPPWDIAYDPAGMSLDDYAAAVLECHYRALLEVAETDEQSLLVGYEEGFPALFLRAADWLGLSLDAGTMQRIEARCAFHAKRPHEPFAADPAPDLVDVDVSRLDSLFAALDRQRGTTSP